MNKLLTPPKTVVSVDGKEYKINVDYYCYLQTITAYEENAAGRLSDKAFYYQIIKSLFGIENIELMFDKTAIKTAVDYVAYFHEKTSGKGNKIPPMNIEQDGGLIKNALLAEHKYEYNPYAGKFVNLSAEQYIAAVHELGENTEFCRIMYLRHRYYNERSKMSKEEKAACERIGWDKIKVKDPAKEKVNPYESLDNIRANRSKAIAECREKCGGKCANEFCTVRKNPDGTGKKTKGEKWRCGFEY